MATNRGVHRSVSEPSLGTLGTIGTATNHTNRTASGTCSNLIKRGLKGREHRYRGQQLWEGRFAPITTWLMKLQWNLWWQTWVILGITYKFIMHLLLESVYDTYQWTLVDITLIFGDLVFFLDWCLSILHIIWPAVRFHIRVYRRGIFFLIYDGISLILVPFLMVSYGLPEKHNISDVIKVSSWLIIGRIYRLAIFFNEFNGTMRTSRLWMYIFENMLSWMLTIHLGTCVWFIMKRPPKLERPWYNLGYPKHIETGLLKFDTYEVCLYYCVTRCFNTIFGEVYPGTSTERTLTILIMLIGFSIMRYAFIGTLTWEIVLHRWRWAHFVDAYHHMLKYLKVCGVPTWLVEQAMNYKKELWRMKNGVLDCPHLKDLPHALQTELIFDVNVAYLHSSLLFRDTGEAFMRQVSLLMRHELYLEGQVIWSQGVVKGGMFCIKKGVIEMLSDEDDESPMIAFKEGTVLGELSLFYSIPSKVTVKAATYVELQILRRTDFMRAMDENPHMLKKIRHKVDVRLKSTTRRQKAIEAYDKNDSRLIRTRYRPMKLLKDRLAGVRDEDPTFVDDSHLYYRDENNERQPKFTEEYLELYELSNNVTTVDAPRICLKSNFPWILEPDTPFTHMFDAIHFMIILYVCFASPIHAVYLSAGEVEVVLNWIVTAGLLLNIYLQLTTCIVEKGVRKVTVKAIAEKKMSTLGFYLDILSVFPLHIFASSLDPKGDKNIAPEYFKLCMILQVWHIWDYMQKWEKRFDSNVKFLCLCKYSLLLVISCYWTGCFLSIYTCPRNLCKENSWMSRLIFYETKMYVTNDAKHEKPLLSAFSFGTAVFTGSGTADYVPGRIDLLVVIFLIVIGSYMYISYMAEMCANYLLSTQRKLKFKESMRELFYFLNVNHVSGKIKSRVRKFFTVQWYYNEAVSVKEIFSDVSTNIQQEVLSIEMVETLLYCPLFQDCSRDFLQTLAGSATTVVLPDNEVIQHGADIGRDMYILYKGHCNILNTYGKVVQIIGPGSHFGVVEMLFGLPKVYTVVTSTNCILRHIEYSALVQTWSTFPDSAHPISTAMANPELRELAAMFDDAKPLIGRFDNKTNRIAQEIKESFVMLRGPEEKKHYIKTFDRLGYLRFIRYFFVPLCITPHGIFLKMWCALRVAFAMYYILVIPYNVAVRWDYHFHSVKWADLFLYIDVIVMAYVAYYNEKSLLISHPLLTVSKYLKTTFIWDALCIFPIEYVIKIVSKDSDKDQCRINRLLLVTRIIGAFSYWESDIMRVNPAVVMLKYIPIVVAYVNTVTAVIFMNSCKPYDNVTSSLSINVSCLRAKSFNTRKKHETTALFFKLYHFTRKVSDLVVHGRLLGSIIYPYTKVFVFLYVAAIYEYMATLFWVFEIFTGCGCTLTSAVGFWDVLIVILLRISGFLYFAFMFGYISSTRSATSHSLLEHNENTKDLENFLYQENVDPALTAKTLKYFEYVWKRTNGSNPQKICRRLNTALMEDTLVFMYEHALREVPLFGKVERSFIRVITQHLTEMYFLKGETVVQCRDLQQYIYIIYRGKVDVLNSYNEMVSCMGPGGMFGNFTGQPLSCSEVSIYASRSLDLLVIPSQTFFSLVRYYPKLQEPLQRAFALSKDYILPITMDTAEDSSQEGGGNDSDEDIKSQGSGFDSRSGSSRFDLGQVSMRSSHSNVSQAKSFASVGTYQSYMHASNLLRPGSFLFQGFGYVTSMMCTFNYVLVLYELVTLNDCICMFWMQSVIDTFFYWKLYLALHQGYVNKRGDMIVEPSKCRARYAKHKLWLWSDIFCNFPLDLFGFCFSKPLIFMHYLRANKIFRLIYLVEFYRKTSAELTNNLTILQTATTIIVVILLLHSGACLWLITLVAYEPKTVTRALKLHLVDQDTPNTVWDYVTSLHVIVSELTGTGGDEFQLSELIPLGILALTLVCGKMLAAMVVATSIQIAYSTKHALTKYERKINELIDMLKNQGLSVYQTKKFWKYVQQLWMGERGRQLPVLLAHTPYVRRCDLMSAMFGHHLRNCYLFADTGESFLRQLTAVMEFTVFFPGNYIVTAGNSEARMYWVTSGTVAVLSVRSDLTETTHERLSAGDVFGILQGLTRGISHCFSYRAETNASILTLSLDSWINIIHFFPEAQKIIYDRAEFLFTQIDV